jgi:hypothetical protein
MHPRAEALIKVSMLNLFSFLANAGAERMALTFETRTSFVWMKI